MHSLKKLLFVVVFLSISPMIACAQGSNETQDKQLPRVKWLTGTWEGIGYRADRIKSQKTGIQCLLQFEYEAGSLKLRSGNETIFHERLNPESDYINLFPNGFGIVTFFEHPESKSENRLLIISPVTGENFNLTLVYNRKQSQEALIAHGVFKKIK